VSEVVDPHVHHWHLSANPWYPLLKDPAMSAIAHDYLAGDYRADTANYDVAAIVHISATTKPGAYLDEARWLEEGARKSGWPAAMIGTVDMNRPWPVIESDLREQAESPRFRGVRVLFGFEPQSGEAAQLLRWLQARRLVFDLVAHPAEVSAYLPLLDSAPDLVVALEHAGWPDSGDRGHFGEWRRGLDALAARPSVYCKISGLAMTLHTLEARVQRPWIEGCLDAFGPDRCMFASNFPVDRMFGSFAALYGTYEEVTAGLPDADRARLFGSTARHVYGL
jgi:predicted TIM-barrel fold metal-dependent hydrolase